MSLLSILDRIDVCEELLADSHTSSASNYLQTYLFSRIDNKLITTNQNKNNISNTDAIHSYVTPKKQNYSVQATSTPTHLTPLNATPHITSVKFHTTTKYPLLVNNICVFRLMANLLRMASVSNPG